MTKEEIFKELNHTLDQFEKKNYGIDEIYEMLVKIKENLEIIKK